MKKPALLFAVLAIVAIAALAGDSSAEEKKLKGVWIPTSSEIRGKKMGDEFNKLIVLTMDNGKYVVTAENVDRGAYTVDTTGSPKKMDIHGVVGPNANKLIPAIYDLDGDTLRICYGLEGSPRPAEFKSPAGSPVLLVTYARKKAP